MTKNGIFALLVILLIGCSTGTQLSKQGNVVQVHTQMSTLLNNCRNLGPVQVRDDTFNLILPDENKRSAVNKAREITAQMGGDTLVLINSEMTYMGAVATVQGVAMRCYAGN